MKRRNPNENGKKKKQANFKGKILNRGTQRNDPKE